MVVRFLFRNRMWPGLLRDIKGIMVMRFLIKKWNFTRVVAFIRVLFDFVVFYGLLELLGYFSIIRVIRDWSESVQMLAWCHFSVTFRLFNVHCVMITAYSLLSVVRITRCLSMIIWARARFSCFFFLVIFLGCCTL